MELNGGFSTLSDRVFNDTAHPASVGQWVGHGHAFGHHGEIVQGAMRWNSGVIRRFLVTLPCRELAARAKFEPSLNWSGQVIAPMGKEKSRQAAEITLHHLKRSDYGGRLSLDSNIEEGLGLGSSTTDVVATIRAVADAFDTYLSSEVIANLAVRVEKASDAIMFGDSCVMFAQRQGIVLEYLGSALPALHILSVNTQCDAPIDTLATPAAHYCEWELQSFRALSGMTRRAIRTRDPYLLGRVSTVSASISQRHLPKPAFTELKAISKAHGACGVQVSHSGTVAGLMFNAHCSSLNAKVDGALKDLSSISMTPDFSFSTLQWKMKYAS